MITVAEEIEEFTGEELYEASRETSAVYNGIVLKFAIKIVLRRLEISLKALTRKKGFAHSKWARWAKAQPMSDEALLRNLLCLVWVLEK